ncbi:hypothetical protein [Thermococcus camini]|uniref:Uncharacterized protein n=1 Tax=Thermococcus camini TaxID=2016373 RepID=A0A7G2DAD3_9EURY|nr:hypothetical protein [Thermococcus camini]CAD5245266.1 protein of unknown function [Thermococcus camini]
MGWKKKTFIVLILVAILIALDYQFAYVPYKKRGYPDWNYWLKRDFKCSRDRAIPHIIGVNATNERDIYLELSRYLVNGSGDTLEIRVINGTILRLISEDIYRPPKDDKNVNIWWMTIPIEKYGLGVRVNTSTRMVIKVYTIHSLDDAVLVVRMNTPHVTITYNNCTDVFNHTYWEKLVVNKEHIKVDFPTFVKRQVVEAIAWLQGFLDSL